MKTLSVLMLLISFTLCQENDGQLFDHGYKMKQIADKAPEQLKGALFLMGQWDVDFEYYVNDTTLIKKKAQSEINLMNRGHALMERLYLKDFDSKGNDWNTISFIGFHRQQKTWTIGTANSFTQGIDVMDGTLSDHAFILNNARRILGGATLTYYKLTFKKADENRLTKVLQISTNHQKSWNTKYTMTYTKRSHSDNFLTTSGYGKAAAGQASAAREFDFLIGTFDSPQQFIQPNNQGFKFNSTSTAVFALNGHAILEFGYYDNDPVVGTSGTSIIRIYNSAMQRWECLYMANRSNGNLYFGGRKIGNDIVLNFFEHNAADPFINRFVFHSVEKDSYKWYGEISLDRGKNFRKNWIIEFTRQKDPKLGQN